MNSLRMFVASPPSTPRGAGAIRPVPAPSGPGDAEVLAVFKRTLLVAGLETSPRFRSDLDLVLIRQHLASLGVFASVAPHVLHYLATECTLSTCFIRLNCVADIAVQRIPDGDVLFYQEDTVGDNSLAYIVLEGSLCGYLNKAFSQRKSKGDGFRAWNSKNTNARGVAIDFGDLQVTYGKGAICGIEDFNLAAAQVNRKGRRHERHLCRHKSVHAHCSTGCEVAQPRTYNCRWNIKGDALKRTAERFGLIYEKGVLASTKAAHSEVAHLAMFSLVSETVTRSMLERSPKRQLGVGEVLYAPESETDCSTEESAFAFVRHGRLDIYCIDVQQMSPEHTLNSEDHDADGSVIPKDAIATLIKGQTFGDQMIALGHPHIWVSNPRRRRRVNIQFKVVASDPSTEVTWITREQFEHEVREDQLRHAYTPIFAALQPINPVAAITSAIDSRDICQITRQLLTNAILSKFFYQFPPLVLERLCYQMEIQHYDASAVILGAGDRIDHVYVVVCGALHSHRAEGDGAEAKPVLVRKGSAKRLSRSEDIHFIPGDAFGARELLKRNSTCNAPVLAVSGTTILCITRSGFERWLSPMQNNTIVKAGSILQPLLWNNASSPINSRPGYTNKFTSATKVNRRQSGPSVFSATPRSEVPDRKKLHGIDEATVLLKRLGLFQSVPRFLVAQMLAHASLITKPAGEVLFREGCTERALVAIISGFVSFYSLEYMAATVDMFQKHPFCIYSPFSGSTTNPEDFLSEPKAAEGEDSLSVMPTKHSSAMYGVHVQTLPPRNAFRTGVLQEGAVCPATVMAQTDCEYLVFDESVYARLLVEHVPAVDMSDYAVPTAAPSSGEEASAVSAASASPTPISPQPPPVSAENNRPAVIPPPLLTHLEAAQIPWFPQSSAKKALLLRSMQHVILAPGQRLLLCDEIIKQIVFVVSGKLSVYARESHEVSSILNASQRSVQSAALERSVASNYSTTSQQLYQERIDVIGSLSRNALRRKIARISEVEAVENVAGPSPASPTGRFTFTNFVKHAAKEAKAQKAGKDDSAPEDKKEADASVNTPSTRRSLYAMVNKVSMQHKLGDQSASTPLSTQPKETSKALLLFYLTPGDIYGDEIAAPNGIFRSVHDIYADTSISSGSGTKDSGLDRLPTGTEILCLDRHVMHAILAKTEVDAANELLGKSSSAKAKWQTAGRKLFKQASQSEIGKPGGRKKAPKLFDFFKNIVNQRRFLTMSTITQFPQLRDLAEDARRELCLNARFEALERYTDAYKSSDDGNGSGLRFYLVLSGRISLFANGSTSHIAAQGSTATVSDQCLREVNAGEGFGEFEILMPESPAHIAAIAAEPTKLLSIPADMFKKHWPLTSEARGNIEYLQTQVYFASLDLEQIAYLYHSFSFQTHIRGTNIFQLHDSKQAVERTKELYLVKEGSCSIHQYVTLTTRDKDCITAANGGSNPGQSPASVKKPTRTIKVLATVADVNAGHVFWVDNSHTPITVVASSASVTIASISLDKLKAIVPRGLLIGLEELSEQLRELYSKQLKVAKRAAATVMNEKTVAQSRYPEPLELLPTLQARSPQSMRPPAQVYGGDDNTVSRMEHENAVRKMNASYSAVHQIERYHAPSSLPLSMLAGSFSGKKETLNESVFTGDELSTFVTQRSSKQNECSYPEHTKGSALALIKSPVHLDVTVPVTGPRHTHQTILPGSTGSSLIQTRSPASLSKSKTSVDGPATNAGIIISEQNGIRAYELDVRARVHTEMCTIGSPMRTMRLEPSHNGINGLGKFSTDIVSPFAKRGGQYRHQSVQQWQYKPPAVSAKLGARPIKPLSLSPNLTLTTTALDSPPALTRKQGFLTALRVSNTAPRDEGILLNSILPRVHQGRRLFYVLVDSELREYADTIAVNNLAKTQCLRRYNLYTPHQPCVVSDLQVIPGEAEALLRQSFLLILGDTTQFLFTAASVIDKQKWMTELHQASVLGGLQQPMSVKVQPPIAPKRPPPTDPAVLAAVVIDAFRGSSQRSLTESRRSSSRGSASRPVNEALLVEYRIS